MSNTLDSLCEKRVVEHSNTAISWFLMASYMYYIHDISILSDACYDELAEFIQLNFSVLEHQHKHLITMENLEAGSMFNLKEQDYPLLVKSSAQRLVHDQLGICVDVKHKFKGERTETTIGYVKQAL